MVRLILASDTWMRPSAKALVASLFLWLGASVHAASPTRVVYLHTDEEPPLHEVDFRKQFARLKAHAGVPLEVLRMSGRTREDIADALKSLRGGPPVVLVTVHTLVAQTAVVELPESTVVMLTLANPIQLLGEVKPVSPSINATGFTYHVPYDWKHLEILRECVPSVRRVGVIADRFWADGPIPRRLLRDSVQLVGVETVLLQIDTVAEIDLLPAWAGKVDAWYVPDTPFIRENSVAIAAHIRASRKPSIGGVTSHLTQGGLLAYEPVRIDPWPRMAQIVGLLISGVPARDIPFERPKLFKLGLNLSVARDLGIEIPRSILLRANEIRQ